MFIDDNIIRFTNARLDLGSSQPNELAACLQVPLLLQYAPLLSSVELFLAAVLSTRRHITADSSYGTSPASRREFTIVRRIVCNEYNLLFSQIALKQNERMASAAVQYEKSRASIVREFSPFVMLRQEHFVHPFVKSCIVTNPCSSYWNMTLVTS
jgi:hypothetical protein